MSYWILWPLGIACWLALGFFEFGVIETRALRDKTGDSDGHPTLSYFVYYITTKFPLAAILGAFVTGGVMWGLAVHFWWHWCPPGSTSTGFLHLLPNIGV